MRLIFDSIGIKTLDCLYHEHLINLHNQCCNSEFDLLRSYSNLHSSRDDIQDICLYHNVHIKMNVELIKNKFVVHSRIL